MKPTQAEIIIKLAEPFIAEESDFLDIPNLIGQYVENTDLLKASFTDNHMTIYILKDNSNIFVDAVAELFKVNVSKKFLDKNIKLIEINNKPNPIYDVMRDWTSNEMDLLL